MPANYWKQAIFAILSICLAAEPVLAQRGGVPGGRGGGGGGGGFRGGGGGFQGGGGGGGRPGGGGGFQGGNRGTIGGGQVAPRNVTPRSGGSSPTFSRPGVSRNLAPRSGIGQGPRTTNRVPLGDAGRGARPGGVNRPGDRVIDRQGINRPGVNRPGIDRPGIDRRGADRPGSNLTRRLDPGRGLDPDRIDRAVNRPNLPPNSARRFDRNFDRNFNGNRGRNVDRDTTIVNNYYGSPYRHSGWNVGYWNPGWNFGYGWGGYGYGPGWGYNPYGYGYYGRGWGTWAALGLAAWALGSNYYNLGYGYYGNPYYLSSYGGWDYGQPIPVVYVDETAGSTNALATRNSTAAEEADELVSSARLEFRNGNYEQALGLVDQAIEKTPDDPVLHEFRALTLFALQKYPEASAAIYAVLAVAPGWNWSTMSSMYPSVGVYTEQLRALEEEARNNPDVAATHFLLGYHYLTMGHADAARKQLETASQLAPEDQVSRQLLGVLSRSAPPESDDADRLPGRNEAHRPTAPPQNDNDALQPTPKIMGSWTAKAQGDDSIALSLDDDGTFNWTLTRDGKPVKHHGKYELEGDTLILDFDDGGGLIGKVTEKDEGFHFAILNGPEDDPGLTFRQS